MTEPNQHTRSYAGASYILVTLALFTAYGWVIDSVPWPVPVMFFIFASKAVDAQRRIRAWENHEADWAVRMGKPDPRLETKKKQREARWAAGFGLLGYLGYLLYTVPTDDPDYSLIASGFAALAGLMFAVWRVKRFLAARRAAKNAPKATDTKAKETLVTVCLPVPKSAPSAADTYALLPDYCRPPRAALQAPTATAKR